MNGSPLVSIVIPTYNSEGTLERCLNSIANQTYKNIETIIVDGGSTDRTVEIAQKMGAITYVKKGLNMTASTNLGVRMSKGKYIYRVDSDVVLDLKLVEEAVTKCEKERYDGVCVFWLPESSISFWAKVRRMEKESYIEQPNYVGNVKYDKNILGARFLKREVFDAVGGLDEGVPTAGEDYAFYDKLAKTTFQFSTITARETHLGEPKTIREIIKKQYHYGKSIKFYLKMNQTKRLKQMFPIRIVLIKNWKKLLRHPALTMGLIFYEVIVYTTAAIGFVTSIIHKESSGNRGASLN